MAEWRGPGALVWRTEDGAALPWPGRSEAFVMACALFAGLREQDLLNTVEGLAGVADQG